MSTSSRSTVRARRAAAAAVVVGSVVAAAVATEAVTAAPVAATPAAAQAVDQCPDVFPVRRLAAGQEVHGLTVDQGTEPGEFTGTVIGVLENGIAPGLDMVLAELESDAITRVGGIWAGMSGSPVYAADGRLIGAVSYGLSFATSPIAGITPAGDMYELLDGGGPTGSVSAAVDLPARLERRIVASGAATDVEAEAGMAPLPTPVAVSGLSAARLRRATKRLDDRIANARYYPAGSASGSPAAIAAEAGGNVGVALSYGDVSYGGVGTITAVCDGEALLFGHPATFLGQTVLSAHAADAVLVHPDLIGGGFKLANLRGVIGTVDQDRLAGLHTELGAGPTPATVRSMIVATDTGNSRRGTTRVVLPDFMPDGAFLHLLSNLDRVADRIGGGVTDYTWVAEGTRAGGAPWRLRRTEKFASQFDATIEAAFATLDALYTLQDNRFEEVTIDSVRFTGNVTSSYRAATVVGLEVRGPRGRWQPVARRSVLSLVAGQPTELRVVLQPFRSTTQRRVTMTVTAPRSAVGGFGELLVFGGGSFFFFEEPRAGSFDDVLQTLKQRPSGDDVVAQLNLEQPGPAPAVTRRAATTAPTFVDGELLRRVRVVAPGP
jgi:hypothetical protein